MARRSGRRRKRRSKRASWLVALGALGAIGVGVAGALWQWSRRAADDSGAVLFEVARGEDREQVLRRLGDAGLIDSPRKMRWFMLARYGAWSAPAGTHWLVPGSPREVAALLLRAPGRRVERVAIPEGENQFQIARRLHDSRVCSAGEFLAAARDTELLRELQIEASSAEGYLFPATYELYANSDPHRVLRRLVREALQRYRREAEAAQRVAPEGWGIHEVLTLASIVEKESSSVSEQPLIASVFFNRLRDPDFRPRRMLQSDPTAGYGCLLEPNLESCAGYSGTITPAMLRDENNPYNTYRHPGLPPGPIANPGGSAIAAVLSPATSEYFFFVAGPGRRHLFSRTFAEHRAAVRGDAPPRTQAAPAVAGN